MRRAWAVGIALALLLAACGDDGSIFVTTSGSEETSTSAGEEPTTTDSSATTAPTTTTAATTTTAVTTTSATSTTTTTTAPPAPAVTGQLDQFTREAQPGCSDVEVSVNLPIVSGLPPAVNTRVNERVFEAVFLRQDRFLTDAISGCDPALAGQPPSRFDLGFEATAMRPGLLSLRFIGGDYYQGAAHPNAFVFTLNFNPATGDLLALESILLPGRVPALAALVEARVIADLYGGDAAAFYSWAPAIDPGMLEHWVVSAAGIEISFEPYLIGPGAMGAPTVVVPFAVLADVVDPAGPAGPA
ncbi:MAG: DUF3298 domain-containing protein [Acidimicrobiia bacterium]|nr:DUF3298 domain-containing protein [Acidimicrobiia bacterium]